MKNSIALLTVLSVIMSSSGCTGRNDNSNDIPRRQAYPRIEAYSPEYKAVNIGRFTIAVNKAATVDSVNPAWLDIKYPRYGVSLHLTALAITNPDDFTKAVDKRLERMALNIGDGNASDTGFTTPNGLECVVLSSSDGIPTPLQFIAAGDGRDILSGTVAFSGLSTPADSVAPIIEAMKQDIDTLLSRACLLK